MYIAKHCQSLYLDGQLTLNAPIATKVVCFSRLLKCLRSLYGKQCGPRSDCSYRSSLFWVQAVCFYTLFASNARQLFAADDFNRRHFQMHFFLGALRVKLAIVASQCHCIIYLFIQVLFALFYTCFFILHLCVLCRVKNSCNTRTIYLKNSAPKKTVFK